MQMPHIFPHNIVLNMVITSISSTWWLNHFVNWINLNRWVADSITCSCHVWPIQSGFIWWQEVIQPTQSQWVGIFKRFMRIDSIRVESLTSLMAYSSERTSERVQNVWQSTLYNEYIHQSEEHHSSRPEGPITTAGSTQKRSQRTGPGHLTWPDLRGLGHSWADP